MDNLIHQCIDNYGYQSTYGERYPKEHVQRII
jgi:hypothetical protein